MSVLKGKGHKWPNGTWNENSHTYSLMFMTDVTSASWQCYASLMNTTWNQFLPVDMYTRQLLCTSFTFKRSEIWISCISRGDAVLFINMMTGWLKSRQCIWMLVPTLTKSVDGTIIWWDATSKFSRSPSALHLVDWVCGRACPLLSPPTYLCLSVIFKNHIYVKWLSTSNS